MRVELRGPAEVAAGVGDADDPLVPSVTDHRPEPPPHRRQAIAERVEEHQVDEQPHHPRREAAETKAPDAADRAEPADRSYAADVAVLERLNGLSLDASDDAVRRMEAALHRDLGHAGQSVQGDHVSDRE